MERLPALGINLIDRPEKKEKRSEVYYAPDFKLYLFYFLLTIALILSAFVLYDRWLYVNEYNELAESFIISRGDQVAFDSLAYDLRDATQGKISKYLVNSYARENITRLKAHLRDLNSTSVSGRYSSLIAVRKRMIQYNADTYKMALAQKRVIAGIRKNEFDSDLLLHVRELNSKIIPAEEDTQKKLRAATPLNRRPLEGLADLIFPRADSF